MITPHGHPAAWCLPSLIRTAALKGVRITAGSETEPSVPLPCPYRAPRSFGVRRATCLTEINQQACVRGEPRRYTRRGWLRKALSRGRYLCKGRYAKGALQR